jgi:hypothetical protein
LRGDSSHVETVHSDYPSQTTATKAMKTANIFVADAIIARCGILLDGIENTTILKQLTPEPFPLAFDGDNRDRKYQILTPPKVLKKAAASFNALPVVMGDHEIAEGQSLDDFIVGCTGDSTTFEYPYLKTKIWLWNAGAVRAIANGGPCQLSASSIDRVEAMKPGFAYDGMCTAVEGKHVAIVDKGLAGDRCRLVPPFKVIEIPRDRLAAIRKSYYEADL